MTKKLVPIGTERTTQNGYIMMFTAEYGWMYKHRYLVAKELGRNLEADEWVYFKDGNKRNFALSNLWVKTVRADKRTQLENRRDRLLNQLQEVERELELLDEH